jgi:large subunit ribosomal protein L18
MKTHILSSSRDRRRKRIRSKISGTEERLRLAVFKSNTTLYAQLINDDMGVTLAAISTKGIKGNKTEAAKAAGVALAKAAKDKKIAKVVFDRGGFIFTGRVRAFADGAREGGLEF